MDVSRPRLARNRTSRLGKSGSADDVLLDSKPSVSKRLLDPIKTPNLSHARGLPGRPLQDSPIGRRAPITGRAGRRPPTPLWAQPDSRIAKICLPIATVSDNYTGDYNCA